MAGPGQFGAVSCLAAEGKAILEVLRGQGLVAHGLGEKPKEAIRDYSKK